MTVINLLREKKSAVEIRDRLIGSGLVNINKHKKDAGFVLGYVEAIKEVYFPK